MRALVGDTWKEGLLDPWRGDDEVVVDARIWVSLGRVDGLYFTPERDLRRVLRYALEFGPRRVLDKIRSRLAERGRNDRFLCVGAGRVCEAAAGSPFSRGDAVCFVATAHPRAADRVSVPLVLVRPARPGLDANELPEDRLRAIDAGAAIDPSLDALAGWSSWSGAPLDAALVERAIEAAAAVLSRGAPSREFAVTPWEPPRRLVETLVSPRRRELRAAVFGLGHYAKTNLIPNLPRGIGVREVRDIDPLQLGTNLPWSASTDPRLAPRVPGSPQSDRFDVVCAAGFHHTHAPLAVDALRSGAWALVEKPVATTRPQLDALLAALADHPGRLFACYHKRHDPLNDWALQDLGTKPGEPIHYQAIVFEVPLPPRHWYRWPASGSRIVSNGCHWIDHFLFLNAWSRPISCSASRSRNGDITCLAELENGASFTLVLTDHGSARLGVRDHVELRAGDVTVVIDDGSAYRAERTSGVIRSRRVSRRETYSRMYRSIGDRILSGLPGDSHESVERSTGLMLEMEECLGGRSDR